MADSIDLDLPIEYVTDHEFWGNACGGFGASTGCEHRDPLTGQRCDKSEFEHRYYPARHTKGWAYTNLAATPKDYAGRHLADG